MVKPVVAIFAAVFIHQEISGWNCIIFFVVDSRKDCRRCLILSVPERPIMYMYRMCVLSLPDLMGYPALWPTLINEVGPKRRKCKAKKNCRCKNLEIFGKFDCDCFGQEKGGDKCRR